MSNLAIQHRKFFLSLRGKALGTLNTNKQSKLRQQKSYKTIFLDKENKYECDTFLKSNRI